MLYKITMRKHACLLSETMSPAWEDILSEAAEGMGTRGTLGNYVDGCGVVVPMQHGKPAPDVWAAGDLWGSTCCKVW